MRTYEERVSAMRRRAAELKRIRRKRMTLVTGGACAVLGLALAVLLAAQMPTLSAPITDEAMSGVMSASIFSESGAMGYIVTGVLSFLLGVSVTVFCIRLRKWREDRDEEDRL